VIHQKPRLDWDQLRASPDFLELFRYKKAGRVRVYNLRVDERTADLWVVVEDRGKVVKSRRLVTFENPDDTPPFLEDVERELRMGGWTQV
jgi:putative intracellular protease/amidase